MARVGSGALGRQTPTRRGWTIVQARFKAVSHVVGAIALLDPSTRSRSGRLHFRRERSAGRDQYASAPVLRHGSQRAIAGHTRLRPSADTHAVIATLLAGGIVLSAALLVPFEELLITANVLTLGIFAL